VIQTKQEERVAKSESNGHINIFERKSNPQFQCLYCSDHVERPPHVQRPTAGCGASRARLGETPIRLEHHVDVLHTPSRDVLGVRIVCGNGVRYGQIIGLLTTPESYSLNICLCLHRHQLVVSTVVSDMVPDSARR
jgi:hypothetical protein